jgi:hypothetical protein
MAEERDRLLTILCRDNCEASANNAMKLARFMGISRVEQLNLCEKDWVEVERQLCMTHGGGCLMAHAGQLLKAAELPGHVRYLKSLLLRRPCHLFLYGFSGHSSEIDLLKELTEGAFVSARPVNGDHRTYGVNFCNLSGHKWPEIRFSVKEDNSSVTFVGERKLPGVDVLMTLDSKPFLVKVRVGKSCIFLAGCEQPADTDASVPKGKSFLSYFSSVVPGIIFLRDTFGDRCWHNPFPKACFIIDDPLLRRQYGFLNYEALLRNMVSQDVCTSVAFIPWNCRRTSKHVAGLFLSHPERYSLSIHGCDHTRAEFGSQDEEVLLGTAMEALRRMDTHASLSGLPFDKVMVFPQGLFSKAALKALESSRYLAAVNTTPYPIDMGDGSFKLAELLDMTVSRFSNFPLFVRRYPTQLAEVVFDLVLGKQVLLVEHHGYFRDGGDAFAELVGTVNQLDSRLEWQGLSKVCAAAQLRRMTEDGEVHVRFYTNHFFFRNVTDSMKDYVLFRRYVEDDRTIRVIVNGCETDSTVEGDWIKIRVSLKEHEAAELAINYPDSLTQAVRPNRVNRTNRARVFIRRRLSEFRDNWVDKWRRYGCAWMDGWKRFVGQYGRTIG